MYQHGGVKPFFRGSVATVTRDIIFGGVFSLTRYNFPILQRDIDGTRNNMNSMVIDILSASLATIISSPWNYVRNMHYATPPSEKTLSTWQYLNELILHSSHEKGFRNRFNHIQRKLRIGWGTARVGCGMAVGAYLYSTCSSISFS